MFGGVVATGGVIVGGTSVSGSGMGTGNGSSTGTIGIIEQSTNASTPSDLCTLTDTNSMAVHIQATPSSSLVEYSMPEKSSLQGQSHFFHFIVNIFIFQLIIISIYLFILERSSQCYLEFETLQTKIKNRYQLLAATKNFDTAIYQSSLPTNWRVKGILVAHLHEHDAPVSRLTLLKPNGSLFVSSSIDGSVRLWDCSKLDGRQSINR